MPPSQDVTAVSRCRHEYHDDGDGVCVKCGVSQSDQSGPAPWPGYVVGDLEEDGDA